MSQDTLLIELGTAELPPKTLKILSNALTQELLNGLLEAQLIQQPQADAAQAFASPRRLALSVPQVSSEQPAQSSERRGPAVQAAFDEQGKPSPAALGFAKSCGVDVSELARLKTDKGEWLSYTVEQSGASIDELIGPIINQALKRLPIAKRMRWGDGEAEFVRPLYSLVLMHGSRVLPAQVLDVDSANLSRGHRFHSSGLIELTHADEYHQALLEQGNVITSFQERQELIVEQITVLAESVEGTLDDDPALLDEVTGLVEMPTALLGQFDDSFLELPAECTISSMRDHQKYFHLRDKNGDLMNYFITVSNIQSKDPQRVINGNQRVLLARLSDARFFWQTDQKQPLAQRLDKLNSVLFHIKLGSVLDKSNRIAKLAGKIAEQIDADQEIAQRAAMLAKADLVTQMVGEFDELQGIMGHYYADLDGEDPRVGDAIEQHYWPRFAGDQLPPSAEAQSVAMADKLDSLVGIFAAGEVPTGDKDPYGLRRSSLAILRILIEHKLPLTLSSLVASAAKLISDQSNIAVSNDLETDIVEFVRSRLVNYYQSQGIATTTINAVMACRPDSPLDFDQRLKAVVQFSELDEAGDLAAANKRISNILKKQQLESSAQINPEQFEESAEQQLYAAIEAVEEECLLAFDSGNYERGLQLLANLRTPVDEFFEKVMVMSDDPALRDNRLALLSKLRGLFISVADISMLQS